MKALVMLPTATDLQPEVAIVGYWLHRIFLMGLGKIEAAGSAQSRTGKHITDKMLVGFHPTVTDKCRGDIGGDGILIAVSGVNK